MAVDSPKFNPQKCTRLALLREEAELSQQNAAIYFGLKHRDTPGEYLIEPFYHNEHYWRPIWPYTVVRVDVED